MRFHIITIFPHIFESYFGESIVKRAHKKKLININVVNLRDFANNKHKTVDDTPFGGGVGMILKIQPIYDCVNAIKAQIPNSKTQTKHKLQNTNDKTRVIIFSAKGKRYTQKDVVRLARYDNLIFICGRYEGVDERVAKHIADEETSIGDYVLSGGEIPAMVLTDSITRLIPGVLGNPKSLEEESFNQKIGNWKLEIGNSVVEYPQYTRPEEFNRWNVPKVLLSGNHREIEKWRRENVKLKS